MDMVLVMIMLCGVCILMCMYIRAFVKLWKPVCGFLWQLWLTLVHVKAVVMKTCLCTFSCWPSIFVMALLMFACAWNYWYAGFVVVLWCLLNASGFFVSLNDCQQISGCMYHIWYLSYCVVWVNFWMLPVTWRYYWYTKKAYTIIQ